jgi:hypothetical protein
MSKPESPYEYHKRLGIDEDLDFIVYAPKGGEIVVESAESFASPSSGDATPEEMRRLHIALDANLIWRSKHREQITTLEREFYSKVAIAGVDTDLDAIVDEATRMAGIDVEEWWRETQAYMAEARDQ